jgi:hypothetical protein
MSKTYLIAISLFLFCINISYSQVGIGTSTPNGALDINSALSTPSTHKAGFLPPSVALSATNSFATTTAGSNVINPNGGGNPATGTIVYNTNTSALGTYQVSPGYYFYNGTIWEKMATGGQTSTSYFTTAAATFNSATGLTYLAGFPVTINVPTDTVLLITSDVGVATNNNTNIGFSAIDVVLTVDALPLTNGGYQRVIPVNNGGIGGTIDYASISQTVQLTAGSHTVGIAAAGIGIGNNATVGGDNTSVLQGELTVTILKN